MRRGHKAGDIVHHVEQDQDVQGRRQRPQPGRDQGEKPRHNDLDILQSVKSVMLHFLSFPKGFRITTHTLSLSRFFNYFTVKIPPVNPFAGSVLTTANVDGSYFAIA